MTLFWASDEKSGNGNMEKQKITDHITRREALRRGVVGAAGLALTGWSGTDRLSEPTCEVCGFASEGQVCYTDMDVGRPVSSGHI